jgi:hypothetical protein
MSRPEYHGPVPKNLFSANSQLAEYPGQRHSFMDRLRLKCCIFTERIPKAPDMYPPRRFFSSILVTGLLVLPVTSGASSASADPGSDSSNQLDTAAGSQKSIETIAREMTNPLAAFYRFDYEYQHRDYQGSIPGSGDQSMVSHRFQATLPFREKNGKGWVFRFSLDQVPDQPIYWIEEPIYWADEQYAEWRIRQQDPTVQGDGFWRPTHGHTDDAHIDLVYGGTDASGLILSYGLAGILPTSSDTSNARQQLILGPQVNIGKMTGWGVYGVLFSHVIDVAEKRDKGTPDTSQTTLQGYFSYDLGSGWQVISNPVVTYDWEGDSGNRLNLPVGGGIAKTTRIGKIPLRLAAEAQYYVASTDRFGPDMLLKFSLSPVIPGKHTRH